MSRIKTISYSNRTIIRFMDEPNECLNCVLEASEKSDHAQTTYRGFFLQAFAAIAITAVQLALEVESGLILRGILLALVISAGVYYCRYRLLLNKYRRLRDEWQESAKGDPTWKETD